MPTILATTSSFGSAWTGAAEHLQERGFTLATNPHGRKLTESELLALVKEHRPVGLLAGTEPVTAAVLQAGADTLSAVARVGIGWDNVDHDAAKRLGIRVTRTVGVLDQAVAELTLGMMLDALRNISRQDRALRAGAWAKRLGGLLAVRSVGLIGYGAIGRRVGELCAAFGAEVLYADPVATDGPAERCELPDLLRRADIVSVHASGAARLLGPAELELCKPGVILVNTARGGMIDETALTRALDEGRVACACLDVFEDEPYTGPLKDRDDTVLTPHVGSYAREAREAMERKAVANLLDDLEGTR